MATSTGRGATAAKKSTVTKSTATKSPAKKNSAAPTQTAGKATAGKNASGASANVAGSRSQSHNDLDKIFRDTLKDMYWAEKHLAKALKKMAKNATNSELAEAFTTHQVQTEDQISKLDEVFGMLGMKAQGKKCAAMEGLLEEANEHIEEYEKGPGLDAALIIGAQKVEHYEISGYGSLRTLAEVLGFDDCAAVFEEIREQESDTDVLLTDIANNVNREAVGSHEEEEEG